MIYYGKDYHFENLPAMMSLLVPKVIIGSLLERTTARKSRTLARQGSKSAVNYRV